MISAESLKNLNVPVPPKDVQQRISQVAILSHQEQFLMNKISEQRYRLTTHLLMQHAQQPKRKTTS